MQALFSSQRSYTELPDCGASNWLPSHTYCLLGQISLGSVDNQQHQQCTRCNSTELKVLASHFDRHAAMHEISSASAHLQLIEYEMSASRVARSMVHKALVKTA
jgi:ribosomal protein S27AE